MSNSLAPTSMAEAVEFAKMMANSTMVPRDYQRNPGNIMVAMQWGYELGLQPMQAMQNICVINGRPAVWGDAMLAIVKNSGLLEYIKEEPTETGCVCRIKRKGEDEVVRQFTKADAQQAGLLGKQGPWKSYPKRMYQMRARAFALRDVFPDVLRGVGIAEEVQDIPVKEMGSVEVVDKATKADEMRAKIGVQVPETNLLQEILSGIQSAASMDELNSFIEKAKNLKDDEKAPVRTAFRDKRNELTQPVNADQIMQEIASAKNLDELKKVFEKIKFVPQDKQSELCSAYQKACEAMS